MFLDLHTHSSGISRCSRLTAPQMLDLAAQAGLDGIVLTNHYVKSYVADGDALEFAHRYLAEYEYTKKCAEERGLTAFFGVEVTASYDPRVHLLIYGVPQAFLLEHPTIYDEPLETIAALVHEYGGALVQAHPYRANCTVQNPACLDGVEISSHPLYRFSYTEELVEVARQTGLILTSGGDFHGDADYRPRCGSYLPDSCTEESLGEFLRTTDSIRLRVQEPYAPDWYEFSFQRSKK